MKIPILEKKMGGGGDWDFFSKLGKKSPIFHWEVGQISAPENAKKSRHANLCIVHASFCLSTILVATVREKYLENYLFSRSGKSQGISIEKSQELYIKKMKKSQGI